MHASTCRADSLGSAREGGWWWEAWLSRPDGRDAGTRDTFSGETAIAVTIAVESLGFGMKHAVTCPIGPIRGVLRHQDPFRRSPCAGGSQPEPTGRQASAEMAASERVSSEKAASPAASATAANRHRPRHRTEPREVPRESELDCSPRQPESNLMKKRGFTMILSIALAAVGTTAVPVGVAVASAVTFPSVPTGAAHRVDVEHHAAAVVKLDRPVVPAAPAEDWPACSSATAMWGCGQPLAAGIIIN